MKKGPFAFFDSANSSYRKALPPDGSIAGYKVSEIGGHTVKLTLGTNAVELRVGMQMRREGEGEWGAGRRSERSLYGFKRGGFQRRFPPPPPPLEAAAPATKIMKFLNDSCSSENRS